MTEYDTFSSDVVANIPYLRAFARSLVKDRNLAEDVMQDTMVRAFSCRTQFQPGTNLRAWLAIILRNRFFNLVRRNACHGEVQLDVDAIGGAGTGGQEEALEWKDFVRIFETLPSAQRRALALIGADGLSYEEAARIEGCMIGTMKSRVSRARHQLHQMMGGPAH